MSESIFLRTGSSVSGSYRSRMMLGLFVILTIIGVTRALQHYFVVDLYEPVQFGLRWHIPFNLFLWWSWLLFFWVIVRTAMWSLNGTPSAAKSLFTYLLLPLVIVILRQIIASLVISLVLVGYADFPTLVVRRLFANYWIWLDFAVYYLTIIGVQVSEMHGREERTRTRALSLRSQIAHSKLNALESQLRPHFLFNTLNTISTFLLKKQRAKSARMLQLLMNLLRRTVTKEEQHEIPLEEELGFISDYLEIEAVRFGNRLQVTMSVTDAARKGYVPAFLLQPIVENSIRYAIEPQMSPGTIEICGDVANDLLTISVADDGRGTLPPPKRKAKEGIGLRITQEKLRHLYGSNASLTAERLSHGGFKTSISIPFHSVPFIGEL